ncbi:WhiB family transcriptional regulator [Amycolatopsis sp. TNS106]|uniref:WhiB family transcriptional regulator n=1 Tax=Amycolatopsis sp. TNS106 TaxID=2861750 RepID=UPI001C5A509F|nr:WhiB family transcriptional regulator [Amycolatopsis sp. TNS106]QXV62916.1 hypothetical protein CVV72_10670 [Amycolatopsis sp. TNS106]
MRYYVSNTSTELLVSSGAERQKPRWHDDALCAETDPELFFPDDDDDAVDAKRICARCEVRAQCLMYALEADERTGVWGGVSAGERNRIIDSLSDLQLTPAQARKHERDATIVTMTGRGMRAPTIAARIGVTDRTVYRVLKRHRAQVSRDEGSPDRARTGSTAAS